MPKLKWHDLKDRVYEIGCDRGVVYIDGQGSAFPGLINVDAAPKGGEITPRYFDGYRYLNESSPEEFAGTIEAFYSPPEFDVCDGTGYLRDGFGATQQLRKEFHFSYRTKLGDGVVGESLGYKIHLVYNMLVTPTNRTSRSISSQSSPDTMSWSFETRPLHIPGLSPSSHFVFDTTRAVPGLVQWLETVLYGTPDSEPRVPTLDEILMFDAATYDNAQYDVDYYG